MGEKCKFKWESDYDEGYFKVPIETNIFVGFKYHLNNKPDGKYVVSEADSGTPTFWDVVVYLGEVNSIVQREIQ